jgi:uncharacterized membrane protein YgcG
MKHSLLIAVVTVGLLTGCSTSNISTQTPDDVYYSPAKGSPASMTTLKQQDEYENYMSSNDDQYLAMKVHNYNLWSPLDDYSYWYDSRYNYYGYNNYANNWYSNPYSYSAFNPYYDNYYYGGYDRWAEWNNPGYIVACYKNTQVSKAVTNTYTSGSNITAYKNRSYNTANYPNIVSKSSQSLGNRSNTNSFGNIIRRAFSPSSPSQSQSRSYNDISNQSYTNPVRVYTPAPTSTPSTTTTAPSSSAGGASGGYNSTGSSSSGGRSSRN